MHGSIKSDVPQDLNVPMFLGYIFLGSVKEPWVILVVLRIGIASRSCAVSKISVQRNELVSELMFRTKITNRQIRLSINPFVILVTPLRC